MRIIALVCLLGVTEASKYLGEKVWTLKSVNDHRTDQQIQKAYGDHSTKSANGRPPYQSAAQISDSDSESDDDEDVQMDSDFIGAHKSGESGAGEYNRVVPARFSSNDDDIFMRSMISKYALEGENDDHSPNGQFWMSEATALAASKEVLGTHKGLSGAGLKKYLDAYWAKTWGHFDVNKSGHIEVIKMPQLCRFLASDQRMSLQ